MCIFLCFCVCGCVCGGGIFFGIQYFQCFTEGFLTQGIVSLICTVFFMGKKESHRKEFVGCFFIGSCHRILGKIGVQTIIKHHPVIITLSKTNKSPLKIGLYQKETSTLQGINISHLGKRKLIFKTALERDMLVPRRVFQPSIFRCYIS